MLAVVMCILVIAPPFADHYRYRISSAGFHLIFFPPRYASIDAGMLLIELFVALAIGFIAFILKADGKHDWV